MKNFFKTFLMGTVVGIGGVAPGLSGSVMLVIFGLYQRTVSTIGNIFKGFWKNIAFLIPLFMGMATGMILFSNLIDILLEAFPMQTRYTFLGLILGTLPLFYKEVKKEGFEKKHETVMAVALGLGLCLMILSGGGRPPLEDPSLFESFLMGIAVAASSIIPGVDSAVILSTLGLYELYVHSVANLSLRILIPAAFGAGIGVLIFSFLMSRLLKRFYTFTFSVIFGLFLSIIPGVMTAECIPAFNLGTLLSFILLLLGFALSFYLSDIKENNQRLRKIFHKLADKKERS